MDSTSNYYIRVPYIAPDGSRRVARQPVVPSGQHSQHYISQEPTIVPCYSPSQRYRQVQRPQSQYPSECNESCCNGGDDSASIRSTYEHNIGAIAWLFCSFGAALLSHLGELALEWCPENSTPPNPRAITVPSFRDYITDYSNAKSILIEMVNERNVEYQLACRLLQQIDHWLIGLLRQFLDTTRIPAYHESIQEQDVFITILVISSNQGAEYLQRILSACYMHSVDRDASAQEIGQLWTLKSVLTYHLGTYLHPSIIHAVDYLVSSICEKIALRNGAYNIIDPDLAAVIDDTIRKW